MAAAFLVPALALGAILFMDDSSSSSESPRGSGSSFAGRPVDPLAAATSTAPASCEFGCPARGGGAAAAADAAASSAVSGGGASPSFLASTADAAAGLGGYGGGLSPMGVTTSAAVAGARDEGARTRAAVREQYHNARFRGLDGHMHDADYFLTHMNPAPHIRPKQEGFVADDENMAQLQLDRRTGDSRIRIERREIGSLFEPSVQAKTPWGAPHMVDQLEERVRMSHMSTKLGGVNPFDQLREGPGGVGFTAGFNAGNDWREANGGRSIYKTVDDLRVREKMSGMNKEGVGGVAEYLVKSYAPDANGLHVSKKRAVVAERGPEHWNSAPSTIRRERGDQFVVAGLAAEHKRSTNAEEHVGVASMLGTAMVGERAAFAGLHEPARRQGVFVDTGMGFGAAGFHVGASGAEAGGKDTRPLHNNRSFNNAKYMDGDEHTFFGAATDMLRSATLSMRDALGMDTGGGTRRAGKRMVGNPRPLGNVDTAHRVGGVTYDPHQNADFVRMADIHQYTSIGNPDRGANPDGYLTMSLAEALRPKESTFYDEQGARMSNARATQLPDAQFHADARDRNFTVPEGAERKELMMAYDRLAARGMEGGNKSAVMPVGAHADWLGLNASGRRKEDVAATTGLSALYQTAPTMYGHGQAGMQASTMDRGVYSGVHTRGGGGVGAPGMSIGDRAADFAAQRQFGSDTLRVIEQFSTENPLLISRDANIRAL